MIIILFIIFLLIGRIFTAVEFCDNASLAKIDILYEFAIWGKGLTQRNIFFCDFEKSIIL